MTGAFFWGGIRGGIDPTKEQGEGQMNDFPTGIHQTFHRINPLSLNDNPSIFPKKARLYVRLQSFNEMKNKIKEEEFLPSLIHAGGDHTPGQENAGKDRADGRDAPALVFSIEGCSMFRDSP